jgi:hypothetical protein
MNSMENIKKRDKIKPEHYIDGLIHGGNSGGSNLRGIAEVAQTHPGTTVAGSLNTNQATYFE